MPWPAARTCDESIGGYLKASVCLIHTPPRRAYIALHASFQPPHAHAGPALVPAAALAAGLLAHPAHQGMVPRKRRPRLRDALGRDAEWPRRGHPAVGRSLRASSVDFSCTCFGQAAVGTDRHANSVSPAQAQAQAQGWSGSVPSPTPDPYRHHTSLTPIPKRPYRRRKHLPRILDSPDHLCHLDR